VHCILGRPCRRLRGSFGGRLLAAKVGRAVRGLRGRAERRRWGRPVHGEERVSRRGRYLASHGGLNEKGIFGRAAEWVDASGTIDGRRVGAAVIDLAGNPRPPFFHARDYGIVLGNAFGGKDYGVKNPPPPITLEPGKSLRLRYAILLQGDVPDERPAIDIHSL
jgi:hypothetical protein